MQLLCCRAEAVLQDDSQRLVLARGDQSFGACQRDLQRLLEQDVLAGRGAALDQLEMRVRRREDEHDVDRAIVEDRLQPIGEREIEALGELAPSLLRRAIRIGHLGALPKVEQALRVRCDGHAEADQCDFH